MMKGSTVTVPYWFGGRHLKLDLTSDQRVDSMDRWRVSSSQLSLSSSTSLSWRLMNSPFTVVRIINLVIVINGAKHHRVRLENVLWRHHRNLRDFKKGHHVLLNSILLDSVHNSLWREGAACHIFVVLVNTCEDAADFTSVYLWLDGSDNLLASLLLCCWCISSIFLVCRMTLSIFLLPRQGAVMTWNSNFRTFLWFWRYWIA